MSCPPRMPCLLGGPPFTRRGLTPFPYSNLELYTLKAPEKRLKEAGLWSPGASAWRPQPLLAGDACGASNLLIRPPHSLPISQEAVRNGRESPLPPQVWPPPGPPTKCRTVCLPPTTDPVLHRLPPRCLRSRRMTASTERSPSAIPVLYSSEAGERAVRAQYAAALAAIPFPHQERLIHTESFGAVHVIISGRSSAPPLMLWHAAAAPAPYAIACLAPLVARFRVFAPDLPCQRG